MQTIQTLDIFNVVKNGGLKQGFIFYILGFFGTLFMTISFLLIIINSFNTENLKLMKSIANQYQLTQLPNLDLITTNEYINNYSYQANYYQQELIITEDKLYHQYNMKLQIYNFINQYDNCGKHCINIQLKQKTHKQLLYLQSICLIFDNESIIGGCYENNQIAQYSSIQTQNIIIQIRHQTNPFVQINKKEIQLQEQYDPKYLIIISTICLFGCILVILQIQLNKKKEITEVEMQEIIPQRVIPLNY